MSWAVLYSEHARKQLRKLEPKQRKLIIAWIEKNLVGGENPRLFGKSLIGDKRDWWRYRIGAHRVLVEINDDKLIILVVKVGHRKSVYCD
jgi:mRNA interferase RelE/StbE